MAKGRLRKRLKSVQVDHKIDLYTLFPPMNNKDLRKEYPELADAKKYPEFGNLSKYDMWFVWYYTVGLRAYSLKSNSERLKKALFLTYGNRISQDLEDKYMRGDIPQRIVDACARMDNFQFGPRLLAYLGTVQAFNTLYKMVDTIDFDDPGLKMVDDNKTVGDDYQQKYQYARLMKTVMEDMPNYVEKIESQFGIKAITFVREEEGFSPIERWHLEREVKQ